MLGRLPSKNFVAAVVLALGFAPGVHFSPANAQQNSTPAPSQARPSVQAPPSGPQLRRPGGDQYSRFRLDAMSRLTDPAVHVDRYRQTLEFAQCASRVSPRRVASLLNQPPASPAERRAANSLMRFAPGCLGHSLVISTRLLRGAAAEAALENYRSADPDAAKTIDSARLEKFFAATPDSDKVKDEGALQLARYAQCQVMLAPGLTRKLLEEKPDSREEKTLRDKLVEISAPCGRMVARTDLAGLLHRSYLAEALYHWTRSNGESSLS